MVEGQVTEILDKQRGNMTQTPENRKKKNLISLPNTYIQLETVTIVHYIIHSDFS
jgi:hypothetical protein